MKILILMPLDEKWSFIASGLFKALDQNAQDATFCLPMFNEWQMATGKMVISPKGDLPRNWNIATFGSLIKAREMYKQQATLQKDFILIGNIAPEYEFDAIFNFQNPDKDEPYQDPCLERLDKTDDPVLLKALRRYDASASTFTLHDFAAAGQYISAYLKTDPHLNDIKQKYEENLHFKEIHHA